MKHIKVGELVLDFSIYPRIDVDSQHVHYMAEAIAAGTALPPIIVDTKSRRVVDGFHRVRAYSRLYGLDYEVEVIEKVYKKDADLFLDSVRYNANHGRMLTTHDRTRCILRAQTLEIDPEVMASALCMTVDAVGKLTVDRVGRLRVAGLKEPNMPMESVALKRTVRHMAGQVLTKAQFEANQKLSGMEQGFYVNQIILLIENGLLDTDDENLMERLKYLGKLIREKI